MASSPITNASPPVLAFAKLSPADLEQVAEAVRPVLPVVMPATAGGMSLLWRATLPRATLGAGPIIAGAVTLVFGAAMGVEWLANQLQNSPRQGVSLSLRNN